MTYTNQIKADIKKYLQCKHNVVNVRHEYCGYSESYWIKIWQPLNKEQQQDLRKILRKYEAIDRDERTGEILEGGNTYLFMEWL